MFYLRQLLRSLGRRRGTSLWVVLLTAVGVGLSATIFAVFRTVLLDPLPYPDAGRLVTPWCVAESFGVDRYPFSWDNYRDYRDEVEAFAGLAAHRSLSMTLEGASRPTSVSGARVTENLFEVLGVEPLLGRTFSGELDAKSAVIGYGLWQRIFAGSPDVLGRTIRLDGEPHTIIGVLPRAFRYPRPDSEIFVPLVVTAAPENVRPFHFLRLVGRLRPGRTLEEADSEMKSVARRLAEAYPDANVNLSARVISLQEEIVGDSRRSLEALFAAVQVLFFVAWVNVAILLLVRGMARRSELELRAALGATRRRLVALLAGEALLLAGAGSVLGLAFGFVALDALPQIDPTLLPRAHEVRFTPAIVLWAMGLTFAGVLLFGALPAWASTRANELRLGTARSTDRRALRLSTRLVMLQVALALPLLVASSMQLRSVRALARVETGYRVEQALVAGVSLPVNQFGPQEQKRFIDRAIEALERLPGVTSVAAMSHPPLSQRQAAIVTYRLDQAGESGLPNAHYRVISRGLLRTLGIPLVSGREFDAHDEVDTRPLVILDERLARTLYPDRNAVGRKVRLGTDPTEWEVIGVAGAAQLTSLDKEADFTVYVPILQNRFPAALSTPEFVLRGEGSLEALIPVVSETLQGVDPDQAVLEVRPLARQIDDWLLERRATAALLWTVAAAALLLAAAGVYATLSFAVGQRGREMAIRSALGAGRRRMARRVVLEGLEPGLIGAAVGALLGILVGRYLIGSLFGVPGVDLISLGAATLLLLAAMLVACVAPARRAVGESPARLLRDDEVPGAP